MSLDLTLSERRALTLLALILGLSFIGWVIYEPQPKVPSVERVKGAAKTQKGKP
ncbi:MAG: hypothetical protein SFY80_11955 [Verrucomicrobiota bacterium]|nr:hypothetical protein [Verrucomicrobiota bacterium]